MTREGNTHAQDGEYHQAGKKSRLFLFLVGIALVLAIVGIFTLLQRREQYNALDKETEKLAVATVAVIHPTVEPAEEDLVLPSTLQAYTESPIYARTTGYLKKWYHDIGTHVQQGELLAEIDTPEIDQQLSQARADLGTMQANENLSRITATRYEELIKTDGVSKQDVASSTLNTEVDVPNRSGQLLPGGYAQVHLLVGVTGTRLQVPVNALLFRSEGLRAVVVDANHKTHLQQLAIGRDYGTALEVLQGLHAEDWIVLNPPDSLDEGIQVNVKEAAQKAAPGTPGNNPAPPPRNGPPTP